MEEIKAFIREEDAVSVVEIILITVVNYTFSKSVIHVHNVDFSIES